MKIDYEKLKNGLEQLTGNDYEQAEREARLAGDITYEINISKCFLAALTAKALGESVDFMRKLPVREYNKAVTVTAGFLLSSDLSENAESIAGEKEK